MVTELVTKELLGPKEHAVLERVQSLVRQWPDPAFYPESLLALLRYPPQFKKVRSAAHLARMIIADYFYTRRLTKAVNRQPNQRHLFVKLLRTKLEFPFGSKPVLGVLVTFNLMRQREVFEEQHMIEAIRRFVPSAQPIRNSFLEHGGRQEGVVSVYVEIEKENGFSLAQINLLQEKLPAEFKGCIEQLVPVTFMRRNEEEVYRNILALRDQLKSVADIPQATITFEEQTQFDLFFTVVVLRLVKRGDPSIKTLFGEANPDMLYIPDRVDEVGRFRKQHIKEATVFRLQLPKSQFLRKDRSVNLYTARKKVVDRLSRALGSVRDFNGGLILKQNERLDDFLTLMPKFYDEFLLENFFYSITPIAMQSILSAALVKEWFLAFADLMDQELESPYLFITRRCDEALLVIVRAQEEQLRSELMAGINLLEIPSLELASSEIKMNGSFCFGFLYRPSQFGNESAFITKIEEVLEQWSLRQRPQAVLRMALMENDPTLDPRLCTSDRSYIVIKMLFEGLTRIGRDGHPQMAMAQSYDVSPDFLRYTFHLREARWSNGTMVTAHDFAYSWKKAIALASASDLLFLIKNAKKARNRLVSIDEVGIEVLDERTLVVELERETPHFLEVTAHWSYSLINRAIDQKYPGWAHQAGESYVSNGPFRLIEWKHNREIVVEKNPLYWDADAVNLNRIEVALLGSSQDEVRMVKSGELDIVGRPMGLFPKGALQPIEGMRRVEYPLEGCYCIQFNTNSFPFNHQKLRQAFAYAIDRDALAKMMPHEFAKPSFDVIEKATFPELDLSKARALFREGLGEIGFVRSDFPKLTYLYCSGSHREAFLRALCEQWREAFGIKIHLQRVDWKKHGKLLRAGHFQFSGIELKALWSDKRHVLESIDFGDPGFVEALSHNELEKAEQLLVDQMPLIPLYKLQGNYLKRETLHGECASQYFGIDFKWSYIS